MFVFRNDTPSDHSNAAPMPRDRDLLYFWGARFVRQTFFAAIIIPFIVIADARADVSFSTVVIDPGHGGWDRGGIPGQIVPEKTVALDTALRLQKLLQRAGLRTVMTRTTDVYIPLSMRSAIANVEPNAIFVSIHYNAARRSGATASKPIPKTIAARFSPRGFSGRSSRALALRTAESGRPNITCFAIAGYRPFWLNAVFSPIRSKHNRH